MQGSESHSFISKRQHYGKSEFTWNRKLQVIFPLIALVETGGLIASELCPEQSSGFVLWIFSAHSWIRCRSIAGFPQHLISPWREALWEWSISCPRTQHLMSPARAQVRRSLNPESSAHHAPSTPPPPEHPIHVISRNNLSPGEAPVLFNTSAECDADAQCIHPFCGVSYKEVQRCRYRNV